MDIVNYPRVTLFAAALVLALCSSCTDSASDSECASACHKLELCGLIPSGLGTSLADCEKQCANTDNDALATIMKCLPDSGAPSDLSGKAGWCRNGDSRTPRCVQMSECLHQTVRDAGIFGIASLHVELGVGDPSALQSDASISACEPELDSSRGATLSCESISVSTLEFFVESFGKVEKKPPLSCTISQSTSVIFDGLAPGPVLAGVRLRHGAAGSSGAWCREFYANGVLPAGSSVTWMIATPSTAEAVWASPSQCRDDPDCPLNCARNIAEIDAGVEAP